MFFQSALTTFSSQLKKGKKEIQPLTTVITEYQFKAFLTNRVIITTKALVGGREVFSETLVSNEKKSNLVSSNDFRNCSESFLSDELFGVTRLEGQLAFGIPEIVKSDALPESRCFIAHLAAVYAQVAVESENLRTRVHTCSELDFTFFFHFPLNGSPKFGSN